MLFKKPSAKHRPFVAFIFLPFLPPNAAPFNLSLEASRAIPSNPEERLEENMRKSNPDFTRTRCLFRDKSSKKASFSEAISEALSIKKTTEDSRPGHLTCRGFSQAAAAMESIGRRRWAVAEGYIPAGSHGPSPKMTSHETVCLLNTSDREARVRITVFYSDREPVGPYQLVVPGRRTRHIRFNDLNDPEPIPHETDFASLIESDVPIVVQHSRLDSRQAENALLSTIAFAGDI